jgi:hypothetical protein
MPHCSDRCRRGLTRFRASETLVDDCGGRFSSVAIAPIRLTEPVGEGWFGTSIARVAVEAHAADEAVGFLQRDGKASRSTGFTSRPVFDEALLSEEITLPQGLSHADRVS